MSWMFQLLRSTTIDQKDAVTSKLYWAWNRFKAKEESVVHWEGPLPMHIKLVVPYDSGFSAPALMRQLQPLLKDGEWMLFGETVDVDVFGNPIRLHAVTPFSIAEVDGDNLVRMVIDAVGDLEETLDTDLTKSRVVPRGAASGSVGES